METPILTMQNADLTLRSAARADRARVLQHLEGGGAVTLDLSRTDVMSDSYADELFGVLAHYFGTRWVLERVVIQGAHDMVLRTIAAAIVHRAKLRTARRATRSMRKRAALTLQH